MERWRGFFVAIRQCGMKKRVGLHVAGRRGDHLKCRRSACGGSRGALPVCWRDTALLRFALAFMRKARILQSAVSGSGCSGAVAALRRVACGAVKIRCHLEKTRWLLGKLRSDLVFLRSHLVLMRCAAGLSAAVSCRHMQAAPCRGQPRHHIFSRFQKKLRNVCYKKPGLSFPL